MDQREREAEGGGRHSGNISKLDLAGENSRYLIAHRLDSINAGGESKAGGVSVCVCMIVCAMVVLIKEVQHGTVPPPHPL